MLENVLIFNDVHAVEIELEIKCVDLNIIATNETNIFHQRGVSTSVQFHRC